MNLDYLLVITIYNQHMIKQSRLWWRKTKKISTDCNPL